MELTDDDVIQILKLIEESEFDELQLETKGLKLVVRKRGAGSCEQGQESISTKPMNATLSQEPAVVESVKDNARGTVAAPQSGKTPPEISTIEEAGVIAIKASAVSTFYRAPKPGAPPFVEIGSFVNEDTTVCILEVMKCFLSVKANVKGYITKICAENAQMVEFGQQLFLVRLAERGGESPLHE